MSCIISVFPWNYLPGHQLLQLHSDLNFKEGEDSSLDSNCFSMNVLICPVVILKDPTSFFLSFFLSILPALPSLLPFSALDVKGGENLGGEDLGGVGGVEEEEKT